MDDRRQKRIERWNASLGKKVGDVVSGQKRIQLCLNKWDGIGDVQVFNNNNSESGDFWKKGAITAVGQCVSNAPEYTVTYDDDSLEEQVASGRIRRNTSECECINWEMYNAGPKFGTELCSNANNTCSRLSDNNTCIGDTTVCQVPHEMIMPKTWEQGF
jgi:hypothetical protein